MSSITSLMQLEEHEQDEVTILNLWKTGGGLSTTHDFFLSHKQSNAQDAVLSLRMMLTERIPDATFWLDLEQNPTAEGMEKGVKQSRNFILYCTKGVTSSKW